MSPLRTPASAARRSDQRKVGPVVATALSVTIVVGAGLLALPGLSFAHAGRLGHLPWLLVALVMLPLLAIFAHFGSVHPSAGGVVGYVRASLGHRMASVCEAIALGTFSLGIPAIALIGAGYLEASGLFAHTTLTGLALLTLAFLAGMVGLRVSGAIQTTLALVIVMGLLLITCGFLLWAPPPETDATLPLGPGAGAAGVLMAVPLILFAFTGWELTAFLAEDMRQPDRNLPISIWASFAIVTGLYLLVAWTVARHAGSEPGWITAPVAQLAEGWLGPAGRRWVGLVGALLVLANVVAAFLSASRALMSAGRDGLLPHAIGRVDPGSEPVRAMGLAYLLFVGVVATVHAGWLQVDSLLQLAGQNFFVLYVLAAGGYARWQRQSRRRWLGYLGVVVVLAMLPLFSGPGLIYCAALAGLGWWLGHTPRASAAAALQASLRR